MRIRDLHRWDLTYPEATALQAKLRKRIRLRPLPAQRIRFVAGADVAISKRLGRSVCAVVVYSFPHLERVESVHVDTHLAFPYIPGLLSFREIPCIIEALGRIRTRFDVLLCDGQGIAHPRGLGLASHLGLLIGKPTIGCAKSRLVGEHRAVGACRGDYARLVFEGRQVGSVLRTREGVKPLFVSPGHLIDQVSCRRVVLACAPRYRLPEPTRWADRVAGEAKRALEARSMSTTG
jgi:deoxyribonuclease V